MSRSLRTTSRERATARGGFTLVEVLAALLLIAIVLPATMKGLMLATDLAGTARRLGQCVGGYGAHRKSSSPAL